MYQNTLNNFNTIAKNIQYNENFIPNTQTKQQGLIRSASTSCAIIDNNLNQPKAPPRRKKRGESLSSNKLSSANSSQYSLVMNYAYSEIDPNMMNTNTLKQNHWTPNSTLRRYMSSDMTNVNYNKPYYTNFNEQFQKPIGVLDQVINRTIPTPPPRISSAKNTLRRRSYVENVMNTMEPPIKPNRQKIQSSGLNQSQFDIPGTPITTHLPPQSSNRFSTLTRPSVNLSSINLAQQTANLNQPSINNSRANLDNYQIQPFYNKTMSLDNLNAIALRQNLRRSPTREELFDYIVQQQGQLSELKTQQKVLEKQVDLAHKEASKAHHHHHHHKHRHRKARTKENDNLENNSIDSSSMISSERKTSERRPHHKSSRVNKNLTEEANKQVHDHIKQLQEQLELIRQKRRKIKTDKNTELEQIDQALDKSIDSSFLDNINKKLNSKDLIKDKKSNLNDSYNDNLLKLPTSKPKDRENVDDTHINLLSPIQTPLSSNRSPLNSRSSSIERAITKRELLRESAKEKWNRSFIEDFADEQLIKELTKNSANQDLLKELLPKISLNQDDKNNYLKYNEILEKNLKLNQTPNWLTDSLDEHTYGEKSPTSEPLSPFSGRTGVFRPINKDNSGQAKLDLLANTNKNDSNLVTQNRSLNSPNPNFDSENIEGFITKKDNNLITGNVDILTNNSQQKKEHHLQQQQQDILMLKKQEDKLIEKLETELMNEKLKQNELMNKKIEIENRQIEHELELEKTKQQLIEQQNLFQEQQQLLYNQRQELEIERWRMEQEKQQLLYEHEMSVKKDQLEQQQALNQQLEQQRILYEQKLQAQKAMQEQLKNELEHQKQLQIKNQQQQQSILSNQAAALSKLQKQQEQQKQEQLQQQIMHQQQLQNQQLQQQKQLQQQQQQFQNQKMQQQKQLEQQQQKFQNQQLQQQKNLQLQQQQLQKQQQLQTDISANLIDPLPSINSSSSNKKFHLHSPLQSLQSLLPTSLQSKSFVQQQQQHQLNQLNQIQNQLHDQLQQTSQTNLMNLINEPSSMSKPRRHRLGQDESPFNVFKPPMHSNSKLNLMDSPRNSFQAINLTTPNISTEHQRPASPRPPFTSNPGLLSSNSSLTRVQPVGFSSSFNKQQLNRTSQENLNRSRQNFYGSNEFDQINKSSNQYFGSGGNLNKTELMNNNLTNLNNLNRSTGSLHIQQNRSISGQLQPHNLQHLLNRNQLNTDNYQLDQYDQKKYSSNTNLNHPRRNSAMDPFRDHFDQYFTPKKQTSTTNLNKPASLQHKISNIDLTTKPVDNIENKNLIGSSSNLIEKSTNIINKAELQLRNQTTTTTPTPLTAVKDVLLEPLDKFNKDGLTEYQGLGNRRLTLPELPRTEFNKESEQIKGYAINKIQPNNDSFSTSANRRKNSLPDNVKSATAIIKNGWNREEVSHLAHEAREAKARAAEMNTTQVKIMEFKDWLISNLFLISLIIFNLSIFYVYLQFIEPIDE